MSALSFEIVSTEADEEQPRYCQLHSSWIILKRVILSARVSRLSGTGEPKATATMQVATART